MSTVVSQPFVGSPPPHEFDIRSVSQSHSENAPSLRVTRPFPTLLDWARGLDLQNMDPTAHSHVPFVVILVRAMDDWRKTVRAFVTQSQPINLIGFIYSTTTVSRVILRKRRNSRRGF